MLFFALGLSAVFLLVINLVVWQVGRPSIVSLMLCLFSTVSALLCLAHPALALNAFLVSLVLLACAILGTGPRRFLLASLGATAAAYVVIAVCFVAPELGEWSALEGRFPMESVADRLAYETQPSDLRQELAARDHSQTNSDRLDGLEKRAESWQSHQRTKSLERLHAGAVTQFINSQGFGVARMLRAPRPSTLRPPDKNWERLQRGMDPRDEQPPDLGDSVIHGTNESGTKIALGQHEANVLNFANPYDFGYVRDRDHVAGFVTHEFVGEPAGFRLWKIEKVELVSMLKFDEPAVYISNELPKLKDLKDAKTRPLDSFESQALVALRHGEDLQVQSSPDSIRMLGAIRALKQCIKCHSVERGDLLGAFSYQLRPERN
jgi:hypothetical protein